MGSPAKLAHVVLFSTQVQVMRDWWQTVLDARLVVENPAMAFLTYDDEHHRIAIMDPAGAAKFAPADLKTNTDVPEATDELELPDPNPAATQILPTRPERGLGHVAFTYDTLGDLLDTYERLKGVGITPAMPINHGPTTSFYYVDPDGNRVELQVDNFETAEQATEYMHTTTNPIGVPIDPDEILARHRAGATHAELTTIS